MFFYNQLVLKAEHLTALVEKVSSFLLFLWRMFFLSHNYREIGVGTVMTTGAAVHSNVIYQFEDSYETTFYQHDSFSYLRP